MPSIYNNQRREDSGQFGEAIHDTDTVGSLTDASRAPAERVLALLEEQPQRKFDLTYVDYRDQLMGEQISQILAGRAIDVYNEIDDNFHDQRYESCEREAKELCEEIDLDWDDLDEGQQERIRELIYDRDESNPVEELTKYTPSQLMRAPLLRVGDLTAEFEGDLYDGSKDETLENRVTALTRALGERGVDISDPRVHDAMRDLVNETSPYYWHEGVSLDVIWYGDFTDAVPAEADSGDDRIRNVTFNGARVVLIDSFNGSGYDVELPVPVTVGFTPDRPAILDSDKSRGYGWDEVAGVVKGAYKPDSITAEWTAPQPAAA